MVVRFVVSGSRIAGLGGSRESIYGDETARSAR